MARTESNMREPGSTAPDFDLPDTTSGRTLNYDQIAGDRATVVIFQCNHCPFVKHIQNGIVQCASDYRDKGVGVVAISANDAETHPDDAPERMQAVAQAYDFGFPYLYDASQTTARAYDAVCTPEFYLFDAEAKLVYRGRFDAATPGNAEPVTGKDLRAALDAVLAGRPVDPEQHPSIGCSIKWKQDC